jgi:hypothetical protein
VRAGERDFLVEYWYPRERQFVYVYTRMASNLGCSGTQRAESTYLVTITLLNHQLSLAEAATRLAKGIRMKMRDLEKEESKSYGAIPRTLDRPAFRFLIGQVTEYAMISDC